MSRKYDEVFKVEALKLAEESNVSDSLLEKNLNIGSGCLYRWRKEKQQNNSDTIKKQHNSKDIKLKKLELEVRRLRTERDILKKAVHIFTTDPNRYSDL